MHTHRHTYRFFITLMLLLFSSIGFANTQPVQVKYVATHLLTDTPVAPPGATITTSWRLIPDAHWHVYWQNPGDSGLPPHIDWRLPNGGVVSATAINWPTPEVLELPPLVNYGYERQIDLIQRLTLPADLPAGPLTLRAQVEFLMCKDICLPGSAELTLPLMIADTAVTDPAFAALLAARKIPQPLDFTLSAHRDANHYQLTSAQELKRFIPAHEGMIADANPQIWQNGALLVARDTWHNQTPERLQGLILTPDGATYQVDVPLLQVPGPLAQPEHSAIPVTPAVPENVQTILLFAFLAGVILNLMPCVLPVLTLKSLSLAKMGYGSAAGYALSYLLGVLVTLWALAGGLLALRQAGLALGWGFHLQDPIFVGGMVTLLTLLALNFFGMWHLNPPGTIVKRRFITGGFGTGVLIVILATPCTVPFMGVSIAYALTQPPAVTLAVFAALGVGIALPILLLGFLPGGHRLLPKPGAWLDPFKQFLGFPLLATALWLLWVFNSLTDSTTTFLLLCGVLWVVLLIWLARLTRRIALILALVSVLCVGIYSYRGPHTPDAPALHWQAWTPAVQYAGAEPVFINATADWCVTCKVTEQLVFTSDAFRDLVAQQSLNLYVADWTKSDPAITALLQRHGREGVPLYLLYLPQTTEAIVLPQLLTVAALEAALTPVEHLTSR